MTPEEYQRIKEAEKQHLQAIKKLKAKLRQVEQRSGSGKKKNSLQKALDEIENAPGQDILDTHEEMIDRLAMDAIHQEARLELALSSEKDMEPETLLLHQSLRASQKLLRKVICFKAMKS